MGFGEPGSEQRALSPQRRAVRAGRGTRGEVTLGKLAFVAPYSNTHVSQMGIFYDRLVGGVLLFYPYVYLNY